MVTIWCRCVVLSFIAIASFFLFIALVAEPGSGDTAFDHVNVRFSSKNSTVEPNGSVSTVEFTATISISYNDGNTYYLTLRVRHPEFTWFEFDPDIVRVPPARSTWANLKVFVPDDVPAGVHDIPVTAHVRSSNGTSRYVKVDNITIEVLEHREVNVEFVGGNIVPYYSDIPQIIHNLLLVNKGNTVERVTCIYLFDEGEVNISAWAGAEKVGAVYPIELAPGEYVAIDVVFFIDEIPVEGSVIPITIEVVSVDDGEVLDSIDSQVYRLTKEEDGEEEIWDPYHVALGIAALVLVALASLLWRRSGGMEVPSA
jgi:hypothetical protein